MRDSLEHGIGFAVGTIDSVELKWYELYIPAVTDAPARQKEDGDECRNWLQGLFLRKIRWD